MQLNTIALEDRNTSDHVELRSERIFVEEDFALRNEGGTAARGFVIEPQWRGVT